MQDIKRKRYLDHYWALFLDFINTFSEVTFQGIPLPILANFYQYLDADVKESMTDPSFKRHLQTVIPCEKEIQPMFERWIKTLKRPLLPAPIKGRVLLNFDYLRLSPNNYTEYFSPEQTVIFARFRKDSYHGMPVHCIKDYKVEITDETDILIGRAKKIFSSVTSHPVFGNSHLMDRFINQIPVMVETIGSVRKYFDKEHCSCVIVGTTEDLISRVLSVVAAGKGIPSICMQHGLLGGPEAFIPVFTTKVAVYGDFEKDWYLDKGLKPDCISVIGHPRYDDIFIQNHMSKQQFQQIYKMDPSKKTILLATQPNYNSLWSRFIELLAENSGVQIIIKPHPWETSRRSENTQKSMDSYEYFAGQYRSVRLYNSKDKVSLFDILFNIDLVVCNYSTVGLETMLFNKPLFILSNEDIDYYDKLRDFTRSDPSELASLISDFLTDQSLQKLAQKTREEFLAYVYPYRLSGPRLLGEIKKLTV